MMVPPVLIYLWNYKIPHVQRINGQWTFPRYLPNEWKWDYVYGGRLATTTTPYGRPGR